LEILGFILAEDIQARENSADLATEVKERGTLSKYLLVIESDLSEKVEKIAPGSSDPPLDLYHQFQLYSPTGTFACGSRA
jgi:hypothetical protein